MPNRLTLRATLVLVALAFGAAFAIQALLGGDSSAAKRAAKDAPGLVTNAPGLRTAKSLAPVGQVPALREARNKKPPVRRVVAAAPAVIPTPTATMSPTPTASPPPPPPPPPRYIPPAPSPKPAAPERTPAPISTPPDSGEFDTTGEP